MLESLKGLGYGGAAGSRLNIALQELQNEQFSVIAGGAAAAALALPGIEEDSTIRSVIRFASGVPSDVTAEAASVDRRASGTLTLSGIVAGDVVSVNGKAYTAVASTGYTQNVGPRQFVVGGSNTETAANLAKAINAFDPTNVIATAAAAVVTVRARARGTGGNSIALDVSASNSHATRSGATLAGGTATNAITLSTTNTTGNTLMVRWTAKPTAAV